MWCYLSYVEANLNLFGLRIFLLYDKMEFVFYCWFVIGLVLVMTAIDCIALHCSLERCFGCHGHDYYFRVWYEIRDSWCPGCCAVALIDIRDSAPLFSASVQHPTI
jgi:hypothetical protein